MFAEINESVFILPQILVLSRIFHIELYTSAHYTCGAFDRYTPSKIVTSCGSDMLRISFINVGYGEAILVEESCDGRSFRLLVDGGKPSGRYHRGEYEGHPDRVPVSRYLEERGIDRLDLLVLTHFHIDHVGGLPDLAERVEIGELWTNYVVVEPPPDLPPSVAAATTRGARESLEALGHAARLADIARRRGMPAREIREDEFGLCLGRTLSADRFGIVDDIYGRVDSLVRGAYEGPPEARAASLESLDRLLNTSCITLRLSYAGRRVLLTADVPSVRWDGIIDAGRSIRSDIMKSPHHGHADGVSKRLLDAVGPSHFVFCLSEDNDYGCPEPAVFDCLPGAARLYATGQVALPPGAAPPAPHRAVVFEIDEEGRVESKIERA